MSNRGAEVILREVVALVKVSFVTLRHRWRFLWRYWRGKSPWDTGLVPPEVTDFMQRHPPGKALDLGCGTGTSAIALAQNGWQVYGIDFAAPAIRRARRKAQKAGVKVHFYHRSVTHTEDLPAPFDLVLDIGCYHALPRPIQSQYAAQLRRLLAPNGTLLLYGHLRPKGGTSPHGLDEDALRLLTGNLRVVHRSEGKDAGREAVWLTLHPRNSREPEN
ncbi:MAG: hypothetical protein Fur0018_10860 [Anaerolineales bacterium]